MAAVHQRKNLHRRAQMVPNNLELKGQLRMIRGADVNMTAFASSGPGMGYYMNTAYEIGRLPIGCQK